jgi:Uncharacterized protein conserved in bacteria (DUF2188)
MVPGSPLQLSRHRETLGHFVEVDAVGRESLIGMPPGAAALGGVQVTHGDVEICHHRGAWRVGIEGGNLLADSYRTLEEAIEVAWAMAARLKVELHVGKERASARGVATATRPRSG